ncbi:MAG: o-succinylbenzoate synthase [Candidatus Planktophila sp.]
MFDQLLSTMRVVALPTKTNFRGVTSREVALFQGEQGWAEFSPFLEYDDQESSRWLACAIEAATQPRPLRYRDLITVNGTIPASNDKDVIDRLITSYNGVKTYKVKVGDNLSEDIVRLARIRSLGRKVNIRIDVNGQWSVEQALTNLYAFYENVGAFEYVEQPCATIEEMRELKSRIRIPLKIAADEVIRKAKNPFEVDLAGAADVLMLKVQPLGGIAQSLKIAEHHGLPVVVSSALESAIGIRYGLDLAASIEDLRFDCGLATGSLMARDVASLPMIDGSIALGDLDIKLDGLDVAPERYEWWKNRAMRCAEVLGL